MALQHYLYAAAAFVLYQIAVIVYRLTFHPLARFPGPKLAAASGWYLAYFDMFVKPGAQVKWELERLHRVYGPIIRISPDEIHIDDYTWFDTLYTVGSAGRRDKHVPDANMIGTPLSIFGTIEHETHRKRRQAYSNFFTTSNVATAESMIWDRVDKMIANIDEQIKRDGYAEMRTNASAMATDIVAEYCMESSLGLQEDEEKARGWILVLKSLTDTIPMAKHFSWMIPLSNKLPPSLLLKLRPKMERIISMRREALRQAQVARAAYDRGERMVENKTFGSSNTVFRAILGSNVPESEKSAHRIAQEGYGVLTAGGETSAKVIAAIMFFLITNQDFTKRLLEELKTVMPEKASRPTGRQLEALPLLTAAIKETLRTHGPVTSRLVRISPNEALRYKDWVIPAGTPISMSPVDIMHDPRTYERPHEWQPDRWLTKDPERLAELNRNFLPFGRGSRMCIGLNLAMAELTVTVAGIVRRTSYDLYDTTRERDVDYTRDCLVGEASRESEGVRVKFRE